MFSNKEKIPEVVESKSKQSPIKKSNATPSLISSDVKITGTIASSGEIQLDGRIEGELNVHSLTIGIHGKMEGNIEADHAVIKGAINGSITANRLILEKTASVTGDVFHETISVEAGASIEGSLKQINELKNVTVITSPVAPSTGK